MAEEAEGAGMKRSPMKRTGFKRKAEGPSYHGEAKPWAAIRAEERQARIAAQGLSVFTPRMVTYGGAMKRSKPKVKPVRSTAYLRIVASLPCINCCITGHSQAAHPNTGKGMGTKTDDRLAFPLCGPRAGAPGCHARFDQGALFTKERRRELEALWGEQTRAVILGMGMWPKAVQPYTEAQHG